MARNPSNPFGSWLNPKRPRIPSAPPKRDDPAPRNQAWEGQLCIAIRNSVLVELTYEGDTFARSYAPYVVYRSSTGKTCVFGMQIGNPAAPSDRSDPHIFEVGRIRFLNLTGTKFQRDPAFDLNQAKYRNRICPV